MNLYEIFIHVFELIFYIFHTSMFLLLLAKRKTTFKGPFYSIFRIVLIADLACCFSYMLSIGVPQSGIATDFYKSNGFLASIFYNFSSYFICVQFIGHFLMSLNRFTLLWFPFKHFFFWNKHQWYTLALIILPFLPISYRLHLPGAFIFTSNGTVVVTLLDSNLLSITFIISSVIYVSTTLIEAILNFLSLIKFSSSNANTNNRNERDLLFVSSFIFIAQLFRTCYTMGRPMFAQNEKMTIILVSVLPLMNIIFAGAGSVSLMILSSITRKEYCKFYLCGITLQQMCAVSPILVLSTSRQSRICLRNFHSSRVA